MGRHRVDDKFIADQESGGLAGQSETVATTSEGSGGEGGVGVGRKLHHAAFVVRPVRRLLQLNKLHLHGDERAGGRGAWGRRRKKAEGQRV